MSINCNKRQKNKKQQQKIILHMLLLKDKINQDSP